MDINTPTVPRLLTPQQAADALGISRATLERVTNDGELRRVRVRGTVRYSAADLTAYVDKVTEAAT